MDDAHLWNGIRYVELNPVRAGMVKRAEEYLWSSAAAHCGLRDDTLLANDFPPSALLKIGRNGWSSISLTRNDVPFGVIHPQVGHGALPNS
jgi:putative transposase